MTHKITLEQALEQVNKLPALPQVVLHILESLKDEAVDADSLGEAISNDPAVAGRLLAAANAGAFGGHPVGTLRQAIIVLGIGRVRQITLATALIDRFKAAPPFDSHRLWLHSVGVALCAQEIARHAGLDAETAYTGGLLHDIGQLLLFSVNPTFYAATIMHKTKRDLCIIDAERELLGIDHAQVGGALARHWNLPADIALAISAHHCDGDDIPVENAEFADVVHVAEVLAHALDLGGGADSKVPPLSALSCARLGLDWNDFTENFAHIEARFDCARLSLGL
jgi:putative nucleotidyltransferase with HDIG domain